jgi:hypothetical protein
MLFKPIFDIVTTMFTTSQNKKNRLNPKIGYVFEVRQDLIEPTKYVVLLKHQKKWFVSCSPKRPATA